MVTDLLDVLPYAHKIQVITLLVYWFVTSNLLTRCAEKKMKLDFTSKNVQGKRITELLT